MRKKAAAIAQHDKRLANMEQRFPYPGLAPPETRALIEGTQRQVLNAETELARLQKEMHTRNTKASTLTNDVSPPNTPQRQGDKGKKTTAQKKATGK